MLRDDLTALSVFLAVAEERSFTRAAKRLGVSPSAISHAMRGLEEEIGVRLLSRTTRSVAPTDAGEHLLTRLRPAFTEVREALGHLCGLRNKPAGRVRILVPRLAAKIVLPSKLGQFARDYPDIVLDVTTDDSRQDIVAKGFDAGIQFGEFIEKDMIAVRVSRDQRPVIVGSPGTSRHIQSPNRHGICSAISVLIFGTDPRTCTDGSSKRARNPCLLQ
jgi:DNA-binding transcriptional LysR family regulator